MTDPSVAIGALTLHVYDHCPFCVRAGAIFGLTDTPLELAIMLNDDEATPTAMIGRKMAPILERDGAYMGESMDIVAHVDALTSGGGLGGPRNPQVAAWIEEVSAALYRLAMPRWAAAPLAEFATPSARAFFTRIKEPIIDPFADRLVKTDAHLAVMEDRLEALAELIRLAYEVNGTTKDDIHLLATLRAVDRARHHPSGGSRGLPPRDGGAHARRPARRESPPDRPLKSQSQGTVS